MESTGTHLKKIHTTALPKYFGNQNISSCYYIAKKGLETLPADQIKVRHI